LALELDSDSVTECFKTVRWFESGRECQRQLDGVGPLRIVGVEVHLGTLDTPRAASELLRKHGDAGHDEAGLGHAGLGEHEVGQAVAMSFHFSALPCGAWRTSSGPMTNANVGEVAGSSERTFSQIADTEVQELEVRDSGVDWVLAQPVHLTDNDSDDMPFASPDGQVREWKISRRGVGRCLAFAAQTPEYVGQSVALSGAGVSAV
jgi:hypothetical protein